MPQTQVQQTNQFRLLATRRFGPLFVTQLLGAFNDNLFKNALVLLVTYQAASVTSIRPEVLVNLCGGVLILPFFLFSATAGQLADKYERSRIVRLVKLLEVGIMWPGGGRVRPAQPGVAARHAVSARHPFDLLRPGEVRPAPPASARRGAGRRQRAGGVRHLRGDPGRDDRRRRADVHCERDAYLAPACAIVVAVLGYLASRLLPHSPAPDPGLRLNWNPLQRDLGDPALRLAQPRGVQLPAGHQLVLVPGRAGAGSASRVREGLPGRRTRRGDATAGHVLGRCGHRFAAHRAPVRAQSRDRAGALRLHRHHAVRAGPVLRQPGPGERQCAERRSSSCLATAACASSWICSSWACSAASTRCRCMR